MITLFLLTGTGYKGPIKFPKQFKKNFRQHSQDSQATNLSSETESIIQNVFQANNALQQQDNAVGKGSHDIKPHEAETVVPSATITPRPNIRNGRFFLRDNKTFVKTILKCIARPNPFERILVASWPFIPAVTAKKPLQFIIF